MSPEEELIKACERCDEAAVARLLQQGVDPSVPVRDPSSYHYQWLPLQTAIYNAKGNLGVVELFLSHSKVNVNQPTLNPQRTSPLHVAAWHCPEAVPLLLARDASVNAVDGYGQTPLHDAAFHGHANAVATLLRHGADASKRNKRGLTALDRARAKGHTACVRLLSAEP